MRNTKQLPMPAPSILPAGFDDPTSPYYIDESIRPFYETTSEIEIESSGVFTAMMGPLAQAPGIWARAKARRLNAEDRSHYKKQATAVERFRAEFKALSSTEQRAFAIHIARSSLASERAWTARELEQRQRQDVLTYTCPECGVMDQAARGDVRGRQLDPNNRISPALRSCSACWYAYSTAYMQWLAQVKTQRESDGMLDLASAAERADRYVSNLTSPWSGAHQGG